MIGLLMLAVVIGANAQVSHYRAEIPFDFEAAGKQYQAGSYTVGRLSDVGGFVTIRDLDRGNMRVLGLNPLPGTSNWDIPGTLTFQKIGGRYQLRQISTATFKMDVKIAKPKSELAKEGSSNKVVVALK